MTRSLPLGRVTIGLAALALVVAAVLAGHAVEHARSEDGRPSRAVRGVAVRSDTLRTSTLERCRLSGPAAANDPACRAAWADARETFFARPLPESPHD